MLRLLEHEDAQGKHDDCPNCTERHGCKRWHRLPQNDVTHELNIVIHGIQPNDHENNPRRMIVDEHLVIPEHGGEVIPCGNHNAPKMNDVSEEYRTSAEDHSDTAAEEHKQEQTNGKQDEMPGGHHAEPKHYNKNRNKGKSKVNKGKEHFLQREYETIDFNLLEQ